MGLMKFGAEQVFPEQSKAQVACTTMSFAGSRKEKDRADIIAYLATWKSEEEES